MGSNKRIASHSPRMRRSHPRGAAVLNPEPLGQRMMHPLPRQYPPFDLLPTLKLAAQHEEMQRLDYENHRLASTHGTLRQELAAAQRELQVLHAQIGAAEVERDQQIQGIAENIARMEAELKAAEPVKLELQQAKGGAHNLVVSREELVSKAQELTQELQRAHADVQQIPALMSELECLRQEYQHCRVTFEYEKKVYNDHLQSLQEMEKNYASMSREVERLRAELTNTANVDQRSSGPYVVTSGTTADNEASGHPLGQNAYEDGYAVAKGCGPQPTASVVGATTTASGAQPGPASTSTGYNPPSWPHYDASAGPAYDTQRLVAYDTQRLTGYDAVRESGYDLQRGANVNAPRNGYDAHRGPSYDMQRGQGYDMQRGPAYDTSRAIGYEAQSRGVAGLQGHAIRADNVPYESRTPPALGGGGGYEALPRGANAVRR